MCYLYLVNFQCPEIVVSDNFVQFYHYFWMRGFANLFTLPKLEILPVVVFNGIITMLHPQTPEFNWVKALCYLGTLWLKSAHESISYENL